MNREAQRSLADVVGKQIEHVIAAEGRSVPAQLFFMFSDGTYLELYAECSIDAGPRLYKGDRAHVRKLTQGNQKVIFETEDK